MLVGIFLCWVNLHGEKTFINCNLASRGKDGLKNLGYTFILGLESELVKIKCRNVCRESVVVLDSSQLLLQWFPNFFVHYPKL